MNPRLALLTLALGGCASATSSTVRTNTPASPNGNGTSTEISIGDLRTRLFIYADDSMGGRATGSEGLFKATEYIARELHRIGLEPAGDNGTYFQNVPVINRTTTTTTLTVDGTEYSAFVDYMPWDQKGPTLDVDGKPVIYGGDLSAIPSMIEAGDAAGKVVVIRNSIAPLVNPAQFNTRFQGAVGIVIVSMDLLNAEILSQLRQMQMQYNAKPSPVPDAVPPTFLYMTSAMAEKLMGGKLEGMNPGTAGKSIGGKVVFADLPTEYPVRNVIGILRGSDPQLRNEYVVVGAHSDHVGTDATAFDHDSLLLANRLYRKGGADNPAAKLTEAQLVVLQAARDSVARIRPPRRDSIYNGADDDGSGSMGVLEIAEYMAGTATRPRRSILFIWQTSEELGLWGSEYFTDHPTVPRESLVASINIDMIGRGSASDIEGGGDDYLQLLGSRRLSKQYGDLVETVNEKPAHRFRLDYSYDAPGHPQQYYCRSDHWNYARYGIPTVFFSTGGHPDYHMITDEPQYIDYPHYLRVVRFIADFTNTVANLSSRPVLDRAAPGPDARCVQ